MATQTIYWSGASGDKLTVTYEGTSGTSTCEISSDANTTGIERSITLRFATEISATTFVDISVTQSVENLIIITFNDVAITMNDTAIGYSN